MVQVKEIEKSSPELQALIESEVKQLLRVSSFIWLGFDNTQFKGVLSCLIYTNVYKCGL